MKFDQLKDFIQNKMQNATGYIYQPIMIRTLVQNNGKATKEDIIQELKEVSNFSVNYGFPFEILTKHNVCNR